MLELDFKLVLLGADIRLSPCCIIASSAPGSLTVIGRLSKGLTSQRTAGKQRTYRMFVRDLRLDPKIELYPSQRTLQEQGRWQSAQLNYGQVACCRLVDFVAEVDRCLDGMPGCWSPTGRHRDKDLMSSMIDLINELWFLKREYRLR